MRKLTRNDKVLVTCLAVFVAMVGLSYASVPLYRIFCQATGFAGTPRIAAQASSSMTDKTIEVRFDANVGQGLPWRFGPEQRSMRVRLGENSQAFYRAENTATQPIAGTATFNVTPGKAAQYFNKVQCFCFTRQELRAGQAADMGVFFFIDPAIATDSETKDVTAVTLSYTFFPAKSDTNTVAARDARATP